MELWPVICSSWARSCANVVVAVDKLTSSPVTEPLTGPETSGRPATEMLPVKLVPVWASVSVTGKDEPPCPALPVHVPATLAVGAFIAAFCSSRAAAQPTMAMHNSVRRQALVALIMGSSPGSACYRKVLLPCPLAARPRAMGPLAYVGAVSIPCREQSLPRNAV